MNSIPPTVTPLHRIWFRRILKFGLWSTLTFITLYALLCAWLNWKGTRELERVTATIIAAGESLDVNQLKAPPIAPSTNFCAIEALDGITEVIDGDGTKGAPGAKRKVLESMKWKSIPNPPNPKPLINPEYGRQVERAVFVKQWCAWFRDSVPITMPVPSENELSNLRSALENAYPVLKTCATEALSRPNAQFTPGLGAGGFPANFFAMPVPHLNSAQILGRTLHLHSEASLMLNDGAAACVDIQALECLSRALAKEPELISLLVGLTIHSMATQSLWEGLESRVFSDAELSTLQGVFAKINLQANLELALRGEMTGMHHTLNNISPASLVGAALQQPDATGLPFAQSRLIALVPSGFFRLAHATAMEISFDGFIRPLKEGGLLGLYRHTTDYEATMTYLQTHRLTRPDAFLALLTTPAFTSITNKLVLSETTQRQALIACALERFYLRNKSYPASLAELSPTFITSVPTDLMDNHPMRYRLTPNGRYQLWSVGPDGKDDNGEIPEKEKSLYRKALNTYQGDWPWRY